ncbi:MAG TPA: transcription elongation factor GreA [Acidobacteriota bacterium]|nr:transcription elongation factor GreA [Acidobacteriota bacterium]
MTDTGYVYLTPDGKSRMDEELKRLKTVDRPQVVREIGHARDHGDISENAEYHAAKEKQVLVERKIAELEDKLARVRIIDPGTVVGDRALLLCFVKVRDLKSNEEIRYQLVSAEEADFDADRISVQSPVGRALLGTSKGDRVTVRVPAGEITYDILDIELPG